MDDDLGAGCVTIFAVLAILGAFVLGFMAIDWHGEHVACLRLHEQTGYATRMQGTMFGGECYINIDNRWVPDSRYRMVDPDGE